MPGEAVTLQLGQYAGCVGAHWWGLQAAALRSPADGAELRAAALLRAGGGREAATPRLVALELKGTGAGTSTGGGSGGGGTGTGPAVTRPSCRRRGRAAARGRGPGGAGGLGWAGGRLPGSRLGRGLRAAGHRQPHGEDQAPRPGAPRDPLPVTPQDAGASGRASAAAPGVALAPAPLVAPGEVSSGACVQLWSDYLNVHLHPRSLYVIRQYMHDGDCGCLEAFGQGESLLQDPGCLEELEDRLHFYVEECDYLQGFQVLCDLHNGFSGVGAKVTELLCDEYSGKGILTWGLTPVMSNMGDAQKNLYRLMNTALGIVRLSSHSSLFCPLSLSGSLGIKPQPPVAFPYINYNASLNYHSSAILAAALDTLTAPYRLHSSQGSMMHLADTLNFSGRKVVAAWASVPFPARCGYSLPDTLCAYQQDVPWKLLSSCREQKVSHCFAQSVVLRGICKESPTSSRPGELPPSPLHACGSTEQILQCYLHAAFPGAFSTAHVLEQPCHTLPPYPQFFSPLLTRQGFLLNKPPGYSSAAVESIPVLAALQSSPVLHTLLYSLYKDVRKLNMGRWASFFSAGVEPDDFQEALEELRTLSQCYETGLEADESEDEADSD